jgi:hypothetical protein
MYCPTCGNELTVELKYCNRCGANLTLPVASTPTVVAPVKLTVPSIVMGLTVVFGLGMIVASAGQMALVGIHPAAIIWMVLFASATLFGCIALMIRFWTKLLTLQRDVLTIQQQPARPVFPDRTTLHHLPPQMEPVPSVTENTTRTFSPVYTEPSDRGTR